MDALVTDLRHALRALAARPGFTLMVVVPLALGIGMNTAIFSAVSAVLLRSLPYDSPERLVRVWEARPRMGPDAAQIAAFELEHFRAWREENTVFEGMAAYGDVSFNLTGGDRAGPDRGAVGLAGALRSASASSPSSAARSCPKRRSPATSASRC